MRHLLSIGGAIFICIIVLPGFWLAHKSKAALSPGILSAKVDQLASAWKAQNTPESERVVDLIISDAEEADAQQQSVETKGAYSSEDLEVLSSAKEPSAAAKMGTWFRRTFLRRSMSAGRATPLAEALAQKPGAVVWTRKGKETASDAETAREVMKAIVKAEEALAEVNIVVQGRAAAPVLEAIRILKKTRFSKGGVPAVSKVVAMNMNRATLKRMDYGTFGKSDNVREIVFIWNPPTEPKKTTLELYGPKSNGSRFNGDELFPMMGGGGTGGRDVDRLVDVMTKKEYTMEQVVGRLAAKAEGKKKTAKAATRNLAGQVVGEAPADDTRDAAPADSLSAIKGGWLKEDGNKPAKDSGKPGKRPRGQKADKAKGNAANCTGEPTHCNWWDALEYCEGKLPSVSELKNLYYGSCAGGKKAAFCNSGYWSSESVDVTTARVVAFTDGSVIGHEKHIKMTVHCR